MRNTGANPVSALGNTFQTDDGVTVTTLVSPFRIEDGIFHALDAVEAGGTLNVEGTAFAAYTAGGFLRHLPKGGRQISERRLLASLKRVLSRLGLRGHLHTFRHAFISHALTEGTPEAIVREWVGHVDRDVVRLYTHVANMQSQSAMERLES